MKTVKRLEAQSIALNDKCKALEYDTGNKDINIAEVIVDGRYPDSGYVMNEICKELVYVISGSGKVITKEEEQDVQSGDVVLVDNKEKYYWIGNNLKLAIACNPSFTPEQHRKIEQ